MLPLRLVPHDGESLHGFIARSSERMGWHSTSEFTKQVGFDMLTRSPSPEVVSAISELTGHPVEVIQRLAYVPQPSKLICSFVGHQIDSRMLCHAPRKVCPKCIKEYGYHRAVWDLISYLACPRHGCALIKKCPDCGAGLGWTHPDLSRCKCGFRLANAPLSEGKPEDVSDARIIEHGLVVSDDDAKFGDLMLFQYRCFLRRNYPIRGMRVPPIGRKQMP